MSSKRARGDSDWHEKRYPRNPHPPEVAFVRPLYPPGAAAKGKTPSTPGPDVMALKRALSRAQRLLPWAPQEWDDTYDDAFAHGEGSGIDRSGVAGFQRQMGIRATGWISKPTFEALRTAVVPTKPGVRHAGEPLFDSVCIRLLQQAAVLARATMEPLWTCPSKSLRARHDSGVRTAASIKHVVIHSTEGGTAASNARFFATTAEASTQLVVDDEEVYRCVPDLVIPWGAPGVNSDGLHIEHCGFARWSREDWLAHDRMLRRSAASAAMWCWQYKVPRRWLTVAELQAGRRGFCCHVDATRAFPNNSGHTDPGPGFPRDVYMDYVSEYYAEIRAAREAGRKRERVTLTPVKKTVVTTQSELLSAPHSTQKALERYMLGRRHGTYSEAEVRAIVKTYVTTAKSVGLDPLLAVSQMVLETGGLTSEWSQPPRRNPAGIGVTGQPGVGISFPSWDEAVRAHVGRLLAYAMPKGKGNTSQRALIQEALTVRALPDDRRGCAPTLQGLAGTWATDKGYAEKIVRVANEIVTA